MGGGWEVGPCSAVIYPIGSSVQGAIRVRLGVWCGGRSLRVGHGIKPSPLVAVGGGRVGTVPWVGLG